MDVNSFNWTTCGAQAWAWALPIVLHKVFHFSLFTKVKGTLV